MARRSTCIASAIAMLALAVSAPSALATAQGHRSRSVSPTLPQTPTTVDTFGKRSRGKGGRIVRTYRLTASEFSQKLANFPIKTARFWGYNRSTPGPTLTAYKGERIRVVLTNDLPEATTIHFHGMHEPNEDDGVAGVSQPNPIPRFGTHTYSFVPGHTGTFAYHSHTNSATQELRGLDGFFIILPRKEPRNEHVDRDFPMVLQQFAPPGEGQLVDPFPPGTGDFPFSTINGRTGEAARGPLTIRKGERIKIRLYNASNLSHSMHLHGHDFTVVSKNGHPIPRRARFEETTQNVAPGDFFEIVFTARNPGNWIFHCHVPHHTSNKMMDGYNGAPVGMTRIFHYAGYRQVPPQYFTYAGA